MEGLRPGDPQWVGRYRLLNRLGSGGMGQVYLGQSPSGRPVAVKIIRAELADNDVFRQRFRQEVQAARRVSGIFTAPVVDADPDAAQPWMVTAFVSGPSLAEAVKSRGPMPVSTVLILAAGLAEGLSAVHAAGVVHRDLKPSNVVLASDGPRIIDFGISRSVGSVSTRAGGVIGSPGYMSPEQAVGEPVGPPADIFSLGSVLAFAATGEPPFGDGPPPALLYRVVHGEPAIGNLPLELRSIVARCLLPDPAARPTTDQLLAELGGAVPAEGWLDWRGAGGEPAWRGPTTVPSNPGRGLTAAGGQLADEMPAAPAGAALTGPPAGVVPPRVSTLASESPEFATSGTGRAPGPPADTMAADAPLAPSPASAFSHLFPDPSAPHSGAAMPQFRDGAGWRKRAALAGACAVGVALVAALVVWLLPRLSPHPSAGGSAAARSSAAGPSIHPASSPSRDRARLTEGSDASQVAGAGAGDGAGATASALTPSEIAALPAPEAAAARVVLAYFAAINSRSLDTALALGGDHLYSSSAAFTAAYANVSHIDVAILGVRGDGVTADIVRARVSVTTLTGTVETRTLGFIVSNGAIVATKLAPGVS